MDRELMDKAFVQSDKSSDWWRQVGSVLVKDGKVIISGYNKHLPTDFSPYINGDPRNNFDAGIRIDLCTAIHAEAAMIATAAKNGIKLEGSSVYVTTFPCPTCARLLAEAGIKKVLYSKGYSLLDAEDILKDAGAEIVLIQ
jgi:dCMP deaminase